MSKLRVINSLLKWKHSRSLFGVCFWLSLLFLTLLFGRTAAIHSSSAGLAHLMATSELLFMEVPTLIASVMLWGGMVVHAIDNEQIGIARKLVWLLVMFLGVFLGACLYYICVFTRQQARASVRDEVHGVGHTNCIPKQP